MQTKREMAGYSCSLLGFGTMRFPTNPDGTIHEAEAERMLDRAYAAGVNYYDTAYPYHSGASEPFVGRVLKKYPRDSYYLATKLPMWAIHTREEAAAKFEEQLERLGTDYVDFYLFHSCDRNRWKQICELGLFEQFTEYKKQGRIRRLGFSFHDSYEVFEEMLRGKPWDFCQIQYNYMDTENQAGDRGYALACELGIPLVVMEPIRGGSLIRFSDDILDAFHHLDPARSMANWALSWVATHPQVKVVLSGMSTMDQVEDNLRTFSQFTPLTDAQMAGISDIVSKIRAKVNNPCTGCRYCMPCPHGVDIPRNFSVWNEYAMYGVNFERYRKRYQGKDGAGIASLCRSCGACLSKCPQHIDIPADLRRVAETFES